MANAYSGAKTVVMCDDDSTPGEVYVYIGDKQATGNAVEKAGLTNGALFGISASFGDDTGPGALNGTFQLIAQGNAGDVTHTTGSELQAQSGPLTQFGRPEDGAWDPGNPDRYYFITTGTPTQPTRLWAMDYYDIEHPELGGTIKVLVLRMRRKLAPHGIEVFSVYGKGYGMSPDNKAKVRAIIKHEGV